MGKYKFKFSHMIPNTWFFKLKYNNISTSNNAPTYHKPPLCFSTTTTTTTSPPPPPPSTPPSTTTTQLRQSYHFTRDLPLEETPSLSPSSPPRKSKTKTKSTTARKTTSNPTKAVSSHRKTSILHDGFLYKGEHFDIIIDFDECNSTTNRFEFQPPPVIAKAKKIFNENKLGPTSTSRRFSVSSPGGVRVKTNSPKVMGRKQGHNGHYGGGKSNKATKKNKSSSSSIWESLAVVKTSNDPQRDFRESMVEMILQNDIRASKDLEDLLACYLSLNSDEYHDVIIKVFKQIWVDLSQLRHRHYVNMVT